jgi:hypothetical protein
MALRIPIGLLRSGGLERDMGGHPPYLPSGTLSPLYPSFALDSTQGIQFRAETLSMPRGSARGITPSTPMPRVSTHGTASLPLSQGSHG